jgi:hypothetical protein
MKLLNHIISPPVQLSLYKVWTPSTLPIYVRAASSWQARCEHAARLGVSRTIVNAIEESY